jgi:hypothetical protein
MFRSLRALEVTRFDYRPGVEQKARNKLSFRTEISYCLGPDMCPGSAGSRWQEPPRI